MTGKPYFANITNTIPNERNIQNSRPLSGNSNDIIFIYDFTIYNLRFRGCSLYEDLPHLETGFYACEIRLLYTWLEEERDKIVNEARKQAEIAAQKELDAVKQQIQIEKDEAIRDIRRQVAVLSVDIAEKVLRKSLEERKHRWAWSTVCWMKY